MTDCQLKENGNKAAVRYCCLLLLILSACSSSIPATPPRIVTATTKSLSSPTRAASAFWTASPSATLRSTELLPTSSPTALPPDFWQHLPIIPDGISERVREIYQAGLAMGNHPHIFSRIGDCASAAPGFLAGFDRNYNLGEFSSLQPAIDYFQGSFERPSLAAYGGLNSARLLISLWNPKECLSNEILLDCQYRIDRPGFAIISLGTNEAYYIRSDPASFERNLRFIIEDTIAQGIVPVLGTKADNYEGDNSINAAIARLALEYELPLWNFWLAAQPLPNQGLVDPSHLSSVSYSNFTDFSIPHSMEYGMQVRNLTALQMLSFLREQLAGSPEVEVVPSSTPTP
jgi:hypothetical protein